MYKKILLSVFLLALLVTTGAGCSSTNTSTPNGKILFFRDDCPHCKNVEAYVEKNDVRSKISYDLLEVKYSRANSDLMVAKAKICNIPLDQVGVPFFWDSSQCIVGDTPIIDYFDKQINTTK